LSNIIFICAYRKVENWKINKERIYSETESIHLKYNWNLKDTYNLTDDEINRLTSLYEEAQLDLETTPGTAAGYRASSEEIFKKFSESIDSLGDKSLQRKAKILFEGLSEEEALLKEREIELDLKNKGYILANIAECGVKAGTTGMKHSEESKHKMSEYWKQYYNENPSPKKGIKMSKESSEKKSKSMMGVMNKSILQYDLQDNFIKEWSSISEAYLSLNKKITNGCINLACKGKIKTAFGYKWKYKNN